MSKFRDIIMASKDIADIEADIATMKLMYYRKLLTKMQCADIGVVKQSTYDYVVNQIEKLEQSVGDYWETMEVIR